MGYRGSGILTLGAHDVVSEWEDANGEEGGWWWWEGRKQCGTFGCSFQIWEDPGHWAKNRYISD